MASAADIALAKVLALAAEGLPCFPCRMNKAPACPSPGFKRATRDPDQLRQLWAAWPGERIGVPMNEESGLFCLDVDSAKHPEAGQWLERHMHLMPETRVHQTESGGWHYLFQHRAGCGNTGGKIHRGIDTRGNDQGYIVWWPAHVAGNHRFAPPAPIPQWLVELVNPPATPWRRTLEHALPRTGGDPSKRLDAILVRVARARDGERNNLLFWAACRINEMIASLELDANEAGTAVEALFQIGERIGLTRREVKLTIESALK
jgi:hypothetical protein